MENRFLIALLTLAVVGILASFAHSAAAVPQMISPVDPAAKMEVTIMLTPRNATQVQAFVLGAGKAGAQARRTFMTPSSYRAAHYPQASALARLKDALKQGGLEVTRSYGLSLRVSGNASSVSKFFGTSIAYYKDDGTPAVVGSTYYSAQGPVAIPPAFSGIIGGVMGLDNRSVFTPLDSAAPQQVAIGPSQSVQLLDASGLPPYTPQDIRKAYGFDQLLSQNVNGNGTTIAIVGACGSPTLIDDLNGFDSRFGLSGFNLEIFNPTGVTVCSDSGWAREITMDIEWAHAIAPNATIVLVVSPDPSIGSMFGALAFTVDYDIADIVSLSWGGHEDSMSASGLMAFDNLFQQAAAQGITVIAASGDGGSYGSASNPLPAVYPASSPYVLAVGGTRLQLNAADNSYATEQAWVGSGGGKSLVFPRPSWQQAPGVLSDNFRQVPDVAMTADPSFGARVFFNGQDTSTRTSASGGTSLSAPIWAGMAALIDSRIGNRTGLLSTVLYPIAGSANYSSDFHDVTGGSNGFQASSGFDLATGLGSPSASNLAKDIVPMFSATVQPGSTTTTTTVSQPGANYTALEQRVSALEGRMDIIEAWQTTIDSWKNGIDASISGILLRLALIEAKVFPPTTTSTTSTTTTTIMPLCNNRACQSDQDINPAIGCLCGSLQIFNSNMYCCESASFASLDKTSCQIQCGIPTTTTVATTTSISTTTTVPAGACGGTILNVSSFQSSGKVTCPSTGYSGCCVQETCANKVVNLVPGQSWSRSCTHKWNATVYGTPLVVRSASVLEGMGVTTI